MFQPNPGLSLVLLRRRHFGFCLFVCFCLRRRSDEDQRREDVTRLALEAQLNSDRYLREEELIFKGPKFNPSEYCLLSGSGGGECQHVARPGKCGLCFDVAYFWTAPQTGSHSHRRASYSAASVLQCHSSVRTIPLLEETHVCL